MASISADPERHLRVLTEKALRDANLGYPPLVASVSIQAVANAFVMLGLLPEAQAEAALDEHQAALEDLGLEISGFDLTIGPGVRGYWESRVAASSGLANVPLSVAAAQVRYPTPLADLRFDWVRLTPSGIQLRAQAVATAATEYRVPLSERVGQAMTEVSISDDTGHSYVLAVDEGAGTETLWSGEVVAQPKPLGKVSWLAFRPADHGGKLRVDLPPPASVPVGQADPRWPTPAESYLAAIAPVSRTMINQAELGPDDTAEVVAAVADGLLATGVLPATSTLLRRFPDSEERGWHRALVHRWRQRLGLRSADFLPGERLSLGVSLPLEHSTAVIEGISVRDDQVFLQLYGHPWVMGEYWPVDVPSFEVRIIDDAGADHRGMPVGTWRGSPANEGSGGFLFWPPVAARTQRLRVVVSTLWEAAWADIELPGR